MKMLTWAAVAVTALFVLMNVGVAFDPDQAGWARALGAALAVAGIAAAFAMATRRAWGRGAVITVGVLNVGASIVGVIASLNGAAIGLVVGGLGVLLGALAVDSAHAGRATA